MKKHQGISILLVLLVLSLVMSAVLLMVTQVLPLSRSTHSHVRKFQERLSAEQVARIAVAELQQALGRDQVVTYLDPDARVAAWAGREACDLLRSKRQFSENVGIGLSWECEDLSLNYDQLGLLFPSPGFSLGLVVGRTSETARGACWPGA